MPHSLGIGGAAFVDPRHLEHGHHPREIAKRLEQGPGSVIARLGLWRHRRHGDHLRRGRRRDRGVAPPKALLILGVANLLADGFPMAAATYS